MNGPSEKQIQATRSENKEPSTFQSIFFGDNAGPIRVPDYQRAYSWEQNEIELFIGDLVKFQDDGKGYYFGHFIAEEIEDRRKIVDGQHEERWEIVDGQQRITTFVLFLMVCRVLSPSGAHGCAYSMIERFSTVSYDVKALETICGNLGAFLKANGHFDDKNPPSDKQISAGLFLPEENFTRSQRRIVLALLRFHQGFQKGELKPDNIAGYIKMILEAHCSRHLTKDKSVAVNIFEMQNTRGIRLTTLEIIKAMLMKFVYDHGGENRESKVEQIQAEFGEIYRMEEQLAAHRFRWDMTVEHLLCLHLRVVDDGTKKTAKDFRSPADPDALVAYVGSRLKESKMKEEDGVRYALNLAEEFKKSVRIVSETLPAWDKADSLVGDVLILDRDLSCQFFLIICRRLGGGPGDANGRIGIDTLLLWEKLLFIRDFHGKYHELNRNKRDNFPAFFASCGADEEGITNVIKEYLANGFRPPRTKGLQSIVTMYLKEHTDKILNGAFSWRQPKMIYAIYKFEKSIGANIREVMKGPFSVEHILPQEWYWIKDKDKELKGLGPVDWDSFHKEIDGCIDGIGNLLLITKAENSSVGNKHPADKQYEKYCGGSYKEHDQSREKWRLSQEWSNLIRARGKNIFNFMLDTLVGTSERTLNS